MTRNLKKLVNTLAIALFVTLGVASFSFKDDTTNGKKVITITNKSDFDIDHIYISPDDEDHWGADILGSDEILSKNESIKVSVDCGKWDAKIVAEDGKECISQNVTLCSAPVWEADC
jgi:hypothetical protein